MARNEYMGTFNGGKNRLVEEVNMEEIELQGGEFMRVRVHIDISRPLHSGKKINVRSKHTN